MTAPRPAPWAGQPSALELELERKIDDIEARYSGVAYDDLPEAIRIEYGRLQNSLLMESQRRSGFTLINITENAAGDGATYDAAPFFRMVKDVLMLMGAGIPQPNAIARAIEDEHYRQQHQE